MIYLLAAASLAFSPSQNLGTKDAPLVWVSCDVADYDGKELTLKDRVTLEHSLGAIHAKVAKIFYDKDAVERQNSLVRLQEDVAICLWKGGEFHCQRADFDYRTLAAHFYGKDDHDYVTYLDHIDNGGEEEVPIVLKARDMMLKISRVSDGDMAPIHNVEEIAAHQNVTVDYAKEFMAAGDHMVYSRSEGDCSASEKNAPLVGVIRLYPNNDAQGTCRVMSRQGDMIKAKDIRICLPGQKVTFQAPKGAVYVTQHDPVGQRVDFSAETLTWDQPQHLLTLHKNVSLYQKDLGTLTSTEEMQVCHDLREGSRELKWIRSVGTTQLVYNDESTGDFRKLVCTGPVFVDNIKKLATMESLAASGAKEQQVLFTDRQRHIFADRVVLVYQVTDSGVAPGLLTLSGHVKLINETAADEKEKDGELQKNAVQYALADVVEFFPDTQKMVMMGAEGRRVLFYDCLRGVQISAPAVNVLRDAETGKRAVAGVGDVRMTFAESEMKTLVHSFDLLTSYR